MNSRSYRVLTTSLIYLLAIAGALTIATLRSRAKLKREINTKPAYSETERRPSGKPFFSLSTHRTYGTSDNARLWVDYQGVDHLDSCADTSPDKRESLDCRLPGCRPSGLSRLSGEGSAQVFHSVKKSPSDGRTRRGRSCQLIATPQVLSGKSARF